MTNFFPKACPLNTPRLQPASMFSRRKDSGPMLQHATWVDDVNVTGKLRVSSLKRRGFSPFDFALSNIVGRFNTDFVPRFPIVSICWMLCSCVCFGANWKSLTPPFSMAPLMSSGSTFSIVVWAGHWFVSCWKDHSDLQRITFQEITPLQSNDTTNCVLFVHKQNLS